MILRAIDLTKTFYQGGTSIEVLRKVSLGVERGETISLVGASGSGKSTLLALLAGLDSPTSGQVEIKGQILNGMPEKALGQFRAQNLSFVFQQFHLMSTLTALENIALPLQIRSDKNAMEKANRALGLVGMSQRANHLPHQLSGGECQRVAIARAFIVEPEILFADEPSGNLDTQTGDAVMELLFSLVVDRKTTLFLVTHNERLALRCRKQLFLLNGFLQERS